MLPKSRSFEKFRQVRQRYEEYLSSRERLPGVDTSKPETFTSQYLVEPIFSALGWKVIDREVRAGKGWVDLCFDSRNWEAWRRDPDATPGSPIMVCEVKGSPDISRIPRFDLPPGEKFLKAVEEQLFDRYKEQFVGNCRWGVISNGIQMRVYYVPPGDGPPLERKTLVWFCDSLEEMENQFGRLWLLNPVSIRVLQESAFQNPMNQLEEQVNLWCDTLRTAVFQHKGVGVKEPADRLQCLCRQIAKDRDDGLAEYLLASLEDIARHEDAGRLKEVPQQVVALVQVLVEACLDQPDQGFTLSMLSGRETSVIDVLGVLRGNAEAYGRLRSGTYSRSAAKTITAPFCAVIERYAQHDLPVRLDRFHSLYPALFDFTKCLLQADLDGSGQQDYVSPGLWELWVRAMLWGNDYMRHSRPGFTSFDAYPFAPQVQGSIAWLCLGRAWSLSDYSLAVQVKQAISSPYRSLSLIEYQVTTFHWLEDLYFLCQDADSLLQTKILYLQFARHSLGQDSQRHELVMYFVKEALRELWRAKEIESAAQPAAHFVADVDDDLRQIFGRVLDLIYDLCKEPETPGQQAAIESIERVVLDTCFEHKELIPPFEEAMHRGAWWRRALTDDCAKQIHSWCHEVLQTMKLDKCWR